MVLADYTFRGDLISTNNQISLVVRTSVCQKRGVWNGTGPAVRGVCGDCHYLFSEVEGLGRQR